jgi:hypothetical protein
LFLAIKIRIAIKKRRRDAFLFNRSFSSVKHFIANTIENLAQFTGTLNVYELNGDLINQLVVFNGKARTLLTIVI